MLSFPAIGIGKDITKATFKHFRFHEYHYLSKEFTLCTKTTFRRDIRHSSVKSEFTALDIPVHSPIPGRICPGAGLEWRAHLAQRHASLLAAVPAVRMEALPSGDVPAKTHCNLVQSGHAEIAAARRAAVAGDAVRRAARERAGALTPSAAGPDTRRWCPVTARTQARQR